MDVLNLVLSEEKSEVWEMSSDKINDLIVQEQFIIEILIRDFLELEEYEKLFFSNIDLEESVLSIEENLYEKNLLQFFYIQFDIDSSFKSLFVEYDYGSYRLFDRKSKDEYRKIKSEVIGEGEILESEGEEKDFD